MEQGTAEPQGAAASGRGALAGRDGRPFNRGALAAALRSAVRAPVLGRGGGTSLAGQCCNDGMVLDFSRYLNRILQIDADGRSALVEPGVVLDDLRSAAGQHGLTFEPDPATHSHCMLGGMIGNNSCGVQSIMAGRTSDNVLALEVLTYDGTRTWAAPASDDQYAEILAVGGRRAEIHQGLRGLRDRHPDIPRLVSGYNLDNLLPERGFDLARALLGSESTCVLVLAEFGVGAEEEAAAAARACQDAARCDAARLLDPQEAPAVWAGRESGLGPAARRPGCPISRTPTPAGRTRRSTRPGWAATCASSGPGWTAQNMMGTAAGLALAGKTPFLSSYATFSPGRWDQFRVSVACTGVPDHFGESGPPGELLAKWGPTAPAIVGKAHRVLTRKAGR